MRKYSFPIDITSYFSNPRIKLPKNPKIETISFIDAKVLTPWNYEKLIKSYLLSMLTFKTNNYRKAQWLLVSIILLVIGVGFVGSAVIATFLQPSTPKLSAGEFTCKELSIPGNRTINGNAIFESTSKDSKLIFCYS